MPEPKTTEGQSTLPAATKGRWTLDQVRGDGEWDEALAAFETAAAEVLRIEAATAGYGFEDEEALLPAHDAACEAMEVALQRMLFVPAPHLVALGLKLELFFDHALEPHSVEEDVSAAVRGDVRRITASA